MKRFQRKLVTAGSHIVEKGTKYGSEALGAGVGLAVGAIVGVASGGSLTPFLKDGIDTGRKIGRGVGSKVGKVLGGTISKTRDFSNLIHNPFDELLNGFIRFLVSLIGLGYFIDDIISDKIIENKAKIAVFFLSIILIIPMYFSSFILNLTYAKADPKYNLNLPSSGYPIGSPFGGEGSVNTHITSYFDDPNYFNRFGKWHKALDIIPTDNYYQTDKAYKEIGEVYIYSICDGTAKTHKDSSGAITIEILCADNVHKIIFTHEKTSFVSYSDLIPVRRGEALGIMGCTGICYGAHVHLGVSENGIWIDPIYLLSQGSH